ncbi:MAG: ABC transporter ATP-binding protein [Candidatus Sumerlaeaceae bacterium]|nr:ABC transporter ATP-binding protein [Candidatus Sumerlaeaceae bacterium]
MKPSADITTPAIETRGLGRRFGSKWAVCDLNLSIPRGCVYGLLGLNGAGKSTTIRMLMGVLEPTCGSARVLGYDPVTEDVAMKCRVGYVPDAPAFYEWMTAEEVCAFVAHYRRPEWDAKRAERLLRDFGVPANQRLRTLSKGQRAKVSLVLALAFSPDLLVLDEPTGGLDPLARRQFVEGVLAEYSESGRTILISSHLINEISGLVDHVGILHDGRLVRSEPTETLLARVKRVRLFYEGAPAPTACACSGLLRYTADGREAVAVVDDYDSARTAAEMARIGASHHVVEDLSLEEAFLEIVGPGAAAAAKEDES